MVTGGLEKPSRRERAGLSSYLIRIGLIVGTLVTLYLLLQWRAGY